MLFCLKLFDLLFDLQGEMGLPGLRGLEGAPGKGIPGEKVIFIQEQPLPSTYTLYLPFEGPVRLSCIMAYACVLHRVIEVTVAQGDFQGLQAQLDLLELRQVKYNFP